MRPSLPLLLVVLVALATHARSLRGEPVYLDDNSVPWAEQPAASAGSVLDFTVAAAVDPASRPLPAPWEPIPSLLLALTSALGDQRVAACHAVALLAHTGAAAMLLVVARRIGLPPPAAVVGALLFAVHPAVVESTAWISGAGAPVAALLGLASIGLLAGEPDARRATAAGALFLGALLSDVQALALLPAAALLVPQGRRGHRARRALAVLVAAAAVAFGLRALAHGSWAAGFGGELATAGSVEPALLPRLEAFGRALRALVWPLDWNPFRTPLRDPTLGMWLAPAAFAAGGLAAIGAARAFGRAELGRALGAFLLSLLPLVVASPWMAVFPTADHHLYASAALLALVAGTLLAGLPRPAGGALAAALVLGGAWLSWERTALWSDDETLLSAALERNPRSPYAHWLYAQHLITEYERYGDGDELRRAHEVILEAQDLLEESKREGSHVFASPEDFRQTNLALGFCLLALAEIDSYFDFETPRAVFETIAESDPGNVQALLGSGMASFGLGELDAAREAFERALAIDPACGDALHDLGRLEIARENWRAAQEHFEEALMLRPGNLSDRLWLARALLQQGAVERAEREALLAHESDPYHPEPMTLLGIVELGRGNPSEALDWIDRALAAAPRDGFTRLQRGHAFRSRAEKRLQLGDRERGAEDLQSAMIEYRRATELTPRSLEAFYSLGDVLLVLGEREVALEQLLAAYGLEEDPARRAGMRAVLGEAFPDRAEDHFLFGGVDFRRGDLVGAEAWAESALAIDPAHAPSLHLQGLVRRQRDDVAGAVASMAAAAEALPDSFQIQHDLGFLLVRAEREVEAVAHLERALALVPPGDPDAAELVREKLRRAIEEIRGG